jgi:hypothetical protein
MNAIISQYGIYAVYIAAAATVSAVVIIFVNIQNASRTAEYLEKHPGASRVFMKYKNFLIVQEAVSVAAVNDEAPVLFTEKTKSGFYVKPGENKVLLGYSHTRPGIMHKTVTTTYGPVERELNIAPHKTYSLSFNRKTEEFVFEEIS